MWHLLAVRSRQQPPAGTQCPSAKAMGGGGTGSLACPQLLQEAQAAPGTGHLLPGKQLGAIMLWAFALGGQCSGNRVAPEPSQVGWESCHLEDSSEQVLLAGEEAPPHPSTTHGAESWAWTHKSLSPFPPHFLSPAQWLGLMASLPTLCSLNTSQGAHGTCPGSCQRPLQAGVSRCVTCGRSGPATQSPAWATGTGLTGGGCGAGTALLSSRPAGPCATFPGGVCWLPASSCHWLCRREGRQIWLLFGPWCHLKPRSRLSEQGPWSLPRDLPWE